jgi:hypothetical protein
MSIQDTIPDPEDLLLDRSHISKLSVEELGPGARVSVSRIDKLAMKGNGPPVDYTLGNKHLTRKRNARTWLRSLLREPSAAA